MKNLLLITLGCKVNQFESASFLNSAESVGYQLLPAGEQADCIIINSCAVTGKAGRQSHQTIRQTVLQHPQARIIITGCYVEIAAREITKMPALNNREFCLVGNSQKDRIAFLLAQPFWPDSMILGDIARAQKICDLPIRHFPQRTRAYLRVQDGCENFCSYCIVPFTRGPCRSLPLELVLRQATAFVEAGYQEIVLTGIHIGHYGRDLYPATFLLDLLDLLTSRFPTIRFRLSSIEPTEVTGEFLQLFADRTNLLPHLHIPLQSGNDLVLQQMGRHYRTSEFAEIISNCRQALPHAAIGIDILAGFPGESQAQADSSLAFVRSLDCTYLHVFPYSSRQGTVAASLPGHLPQQEKKQRVAALRLLGKEKQQAFYQRFLNTTRPVLVEGKTNSLGFKKGWTDNYIPVIVKGNGILTNTIVPVRLLYLDGDVLQGEIDRHEH